MRKGGRKTSEFKNQSTKSLHSNLILWQIKKRSATITLAKKKKKKHQSPQNKVRTEFYMRTISPLSSLKHRPLLTLLPEASAGTMRYSRGFSNLQMLQNHFACMKHWLTKKVWSRTWDSAFSQALGCLLPLLVWGTKKWKKWKCQSLSHVWFFETPGIVVRQAPLCMGFSR